MHHQGWANISTSVHRDTTWQRTRQTIIAKPQDRRLIYHKTFLSCQNRSYGVIPIGFSLTRRSQDLSVLFSFFHTVLFLILFILSQISFIVLLKQIYHGIYSKTNIVFQVPFLFISWLFIYLFSYWFRVSNIYSISVK